MTTDDAEDRLRSFCRELIQRISAHDALEYDESQSRLPGEADASAKLFFLDARGYQWTLEVPGDAGEMELAGTSVNSAEFDFRNGYNVGFFGGSGGYVGGSDAEDPEAASLAIKDAEDAAERIWQEMRLHVPGLVKQSE